MSDKNDLKEERIDFGSLIQRCQSYMGVGCSRMDHIMADMKQ